MKVRTKVNKYSVIFAMMAEKGIDQEERGSIVSEFTKGRTKSLRELSDSELMDLRLTLQRYTQKRDQSDMMRKKVIYLLCSMKKLHLRKSNEVLVFENARQKANMSDIYKFVLKVGYAKKPFNDYTAAELVKLVTQFEKIRANTWNAEANALVADLMTEL